MKKDNKIDLTEYINPENELSEEMIQAYLDAAEMDTPDLWTDVAAGYEKEYKELIKERQLNKARRKKYWGVAAAVLLVTIIVVPVIMMQSQSSKDEKKDSYHMSSEAFTDNMDNNMEATENAIYNESPDMSNEYEDGIDCDVNGVSAEEPCNDNSNDSEQISASISKDYIAIEGEILVSSDGKYIVYINDVTENTYDNYNIASGQSIEIINTEDFEKILSNNGISIEEISDKKHILVFDSVNVLQSEDAKYEGKINEIKIN